MKYFQEHHKLNKKQARWYLKLQDYNFILQYIPGKTNTKVDILLRKNQVNTKENNKRYRPFRISKNIGSEAFQLELLEGWMIHNIFNKDLLTQCVELKFKGQHEKPAPPLIIINEEEEYEVEEVRKHRKCERET